LSSHTKPGLGRRGRRWLNRRTALAAVASVAATGIAGAAMVADAAVPSFPDNIVVFPDRDFVSVEGYQNHVNETALLQVTRGGQVIGSAKAVVEEGDVAFEVNHPGGACWGNDTDLKVTPDIRPGDKVSISFNGIDAGETTVANAFVTEDMSLVTGSSGAKDTLVVKGFVGPGVKTAQMEQRIINPDLVDTAIGRRDIRALPGPLTASDKGGYSSSLTFTGDEVTGGTFTATYVFQDAADALIASQADLGERAMSWQVEDADANRQGLTIAEFGEAGGPGMGGCPAGPGDAGAPKPGGASIVRSTDKKSLSVSWTPKDQVPTADPVTGFSVEAIQQSASTTGEQVVLGKRTGALATHANIDGLDPTLGYDVEVRSIAAGKMSEAFTVQVPSPEAPGDVTPPTLTADPADTQAVNIASKVTLSSDDVNAEIYYTIDGKPAIVGGLPSDTARLYTEPIVLSKQVTLHAVAFDRAGNAKTFQATYAPPASTTPAPAPVSAITGTAGMQSVTLSWAAPEPGVTGYSVQAYVDGVKVGDPRETTDRTITISGLTAETKYFFTVTAKNGTLSSTESTPYGPLSPTRVTDTVSISRATWKSGEFRVRGSGSVVGALVTIYRAGTDGKIDRSSSLGQGQVVAAAPPAIGEFDIRLRNGAAGTTNPGRIFVESDGGGVAGPTTVTAG
jgi:hypothetical protein